MRELGFALLSAGLAFNVLTDRLVVPGAALGFSRKPGILPRHLTAFFLALLPSLWLSWAISAYVPFPTSLKWVLYLGVSGLVVWAGKGVCANWLREKDLGAHIGLLPANCAFFGTILLVLSGPQGLAIATAKGVGAALGYGLILYLLTSFRNRLKGSPTPKALSGVPSALILLGLISMVLMGLAQAFHLYR
jgi:Na+-translocating ferredoxin:NAD+ oxidoreductase RnfA subunit